MLPRSKSSTVTPAGGSQYVSMAEDPGRTHNRQLWRTGGQEGADLIPTTTRRSLAFAVCGILTIIGSSCGGNNTPPQTKVGPSGGSVSFQITGDPDTLDPQLTRVTLGYQFAIFLYDRLVNLDSKGKVVSGLAKSWTVASDSVTFTLRDDPTCADGTPVTPDVVVGSMKRMADPATKAPYAARVFGTGVPTITGDNSARTVTIKTATNFSELLPNLAHPASSVICPAGLQKPIVLATKPAGSGAMTLVQATRGDSYTLKARSGYKWGPSGQQMLGPGGPDQLVIKVIANSSTAANLLLTGGLDIAAIQGSDTDRLAAQGGLFKLQVIAGTDTLQMNQAVGRITSDPVIRQAIEMAIDRASYTKARTGGHGAVALSYVVPGANCFDSSVQAGFPKYDLNAAKALLQNNGWTLSSDGKFSKNGKPLTVKLVGQQVQDVGPDYLLDALQKAGFTVTFAKQDMATWVDTVYTKADFDLTPVPTGATSTPAGVGSVLTGKAPPNGLNSMSLNDKEYESFAQQALTNSAQRCELWSKAEQALVKHYDLLPLAYPYTTFFGKSIRFQTGFGILLEPTSLQRTA